MQSTAPASGARWQKATEAFDLLPIDAAVDVHIKGSPPDAVMESLEETGMKATDNENARRQGTDLDRCYGKIGISAVAAALPYQSDSRNPAYAPAATRPRQDDEPN